MMSRTISAGRRFTVVALTVALTAALSTVLVTLPSAQSASASSGPLPTKSRWLKDVAAVMAPSGSFLDARVSAGGTRLAVVLDIDNTSIATHYHWPRPVRKTRAFARKATGLGVKVFFVTGRKQKNALAQRGTLTRAGYTVAGICGRRSGEGLVRSKTRCRTALADRGFTIIASVGNRRTDFRGPYVGRVFDLPDYRGALS